MRDALIDPAVGDVLALPAGVQWRVLDLFVSVDYETGKRRGVLVEIDESGSARRHCLSIDQFRRAVRGGRSRVKSLSSADWSKVRHIAAPLVCAAMASGAWPPQMDAQDAA